MFKTPLKNWTKGEALSPVSDADIAVDVLLRERLTGDDAAIAWLSEESVDDPARLDARYVWIVDPIDGTRAYIAGLPDWAVSAALVENGRPVAGLPLRAGQRRVLLCRRGPRRDPQRRRDRGRARRRACASAHRRAAKIARTLAAIAPPFAVMPRIHSLALRLARVAEGTFDAGIAGGNSHDWDLAAADLLVHEAGGALTSFAGDTVTYNRPVPRHGTLVAAGRDRHAALVELFRDERLASL